MYCTTDSSNNMISVLHRTLGINSFYIQALVSDLFGGGVGRDEELGDGGMEKLLRALEWQAA